MERSRISIRVGTTTLSLAALLALAACGSSSSSSSSSAPTSGSSAGAAVGLAQPGPSNDHSFGQATHDGALRAQQQLGIKLTEVDNLVTPQQQTPALEALARTNKLVMMDGAISAAGVYQKYPNTQFVVTDGTLPAAPNTHSVAQNWVPVAYLAGVAAAHTTKTKTIGFVGGIPIPVIAEALRGYTAGAHSVDPSIKVLSTDIGSFTDAVKGKEAAAAQIASGADVLYADLDTAHTGVVQAAQQSGKPVKVIGSVAPKCDISSGLDIGDTVFDQSRIVFTTIQRFVNGPFPPTLSFGLAGGYSSFPLCPGASASLRSAIARTTAGLVAGTIHT